MRPNRDWMYKRFLDDGTLNPEFLAGLEGFTKFATSQPRYMDGDKIKCPCTVCKNISYGEESSVRLDVCLNGFVPNYHIWMFHGETSGVVDRTNTHQSVVNLVIDAAGPDFGMEDPKEPLHPTAKKIYGVSKIVDKELWSGCETHTQLSFVARLMTLKSDNSLSNKCFDQITQLTKEIAPEDNLVPEDLYETKKLLLGMQLHVKTDCCANNCVIYWGNGSTLAHCKFCASELSQTSDGSGGQDDGAHNNVMTKGVELSQPNNGSKSQEFNTSQLLPEAVGGVSKKKRVSGVGSRSRASTSGSSIAPSVSSEPQIKTVLAESMKELEAQMNTRVEAEVQARESQIRADMQAQVQAEVQARESQIRADVQAQLQAQQAAFEEMMAQMRGAAGFPPPPS